MFFDTFNLVEAVDRNGIKPAKANIQIEILIVDDQALARESLSQILNSTLLN